MGVGLRGVAGEGGGGGAMADEGKARKGKGERGRKADTEKKEIQITTSFLF